MVQLGPKVDLDLSIQNALQIFHDYIQCRQKHRMFQKSELENQLNLLNNEINIELLQKDFNELRKITHNLNNIIKSPLMKKYGDDFWNTNGSALKKIVDANQILIITTLQLQEEILALKSENK